MKLAHTVGLLALAAILSASCSSTETENELWSKSKVLRSQEDHDESIEALEKMLRSYPDGVHTSEGRFLLADAYTNIKKDYANAVTEYRRVTLEYADSDLAPKAQFMIGYIYANYIKDYDKAQAAYLEFQEKYSNDDLSKAVNFELEYLGKNLDEISALKNIINH